jgi:hypothetical protein
LASERAEEDVLCPFLEPLEIPSPASSSTAGLGSLLSQEFDGSHLQHPGSVKKRLHCSPVFCLTFDTMTLPSNGSLTASQLSSSISSLSPSRGASSEISKVYKQASQLFLTRRLLESLSTIQSVISVPAIPEDERISDDDESPPQALIASASSKLRIKIWSLYITLLNAIIELGPEDGKRAFGIKEWKALVSSARDGEVWETVVKVGYGGREGSVDADVVNNLYASLKP